MRRGAGRGGHSGRGGASSSRVSGGVSSEDEGLEACGKPAKRQPDDMTPGTKQPASKPRVEGQAAAAEPPPWIAELMAQVAGLHGKFDAHTAALNTRMDDLEKRVAKTERDEEKTSNSLARHDGDIATLKKKASELEKRVHAIQAQVDDTPGAGELKDLKGQIQSTRDAVVQLKREMQQRADLPELQELRDELAGLKRQLDGVTAPDAHALAAEVHEILNAQGAPAPAPAAGPPACTVVGEALAREQAQCGLLVKLEGMMERRDGQSCDLRGGTGCTQPHGRGGCSH